MKNKTTPKSKDSIKLALSESFDQVTTKIASLSEEQLHFKSTGKWSPAENLSHLILSTFPITAALNKSKIVFRMFGTSSSGSRTYEEMHAFYKSKLAEGISTTGSKFDTNPKDAADVPKMLENWKTIGSKFEARLDKWSEKDLDKYRVPHPVLGKLTFREVLFFTNFHNYIHLDIINQRLKEHG